MKTTYKIAAQGLLALAAWLPAAAQAEINPDSYPEESSVVGQEAQVSTLQARLQEERQLQVKAEQVEAARQDAISAGIQGDGAGSYIDVYRQQQTEFEQLRAALTSPMSVPRQESQVGTLQARLEDYEQLQRVKAELVETARQEAISAGIQGDGAGSYIDVYRQQQKELELLQAALTPQIDQTRKLIAGLNRPGLTAVSSVNLVPTPLRKHKAASKQKAARPDQTRVAVLNR